MPIPDCESNHHLLSIIPIRIIPTIYILILILMLGLRINNPTDTSRQQKLQLKRSLQRFYMRFPLFLPPPAFGTLVVVVWVVVQVRIDMTTVQRQGIREIACRFYGCQG
jgi:hypothetical protein